MIVHTLGTNAYGEDVTSCVLEELEAPPDADFDDQYSDREQAGIDVLEDLASKQNPVKVSAWRKKLKGTSPFQEIENKETLKRAITRVRDMLRDNGLAECDKENQWVTYIGDKGGDTENG